MTLERHRPWAGGQVHPAPASGGGVLVRSVAARQRVEHAVAAVAFAPFPAPGPAAACRPFAAAFSADSSFRWISTILGRLEVEPHRVLPEYRAAKDRLAAAAKTRQRQHAGTAPGRKVNTSGEAASSVSRRALQTRNEVGKLAGVGGRLIQDAALGWKKAPKQAANATPGLADKPIPERLA
jgi:hypothetical protein